MINTHDGDKRGSMSNSELQEAITMANAMVKSTGQDSPTYKTLRDHLEKLLHIQRDRAELVSCVSIKSDHRRPFRIETVKGD